MANAVKRVGLISDTHGLLRKEALEALRGSELIIHAGDVGKREILEELRKIASVVAVRGNVDTEPWGKGLPGNAGGGRGPGFVFLPSPGHSPGLYSASTRFYLLRQGPFPQ